MFGTCKEKLNDIYDNNKDKIGGRTRIKRR